MPCTDCGILVPGPGMEPEPLAVRPQSPIHWTAREFLLFHFLCENIFTFKHMCQRWKQVTSSHEKPVSLVRNYRTESQKEKYDS